MNLYDLYFSSLPGNRREAPASCQMTRQSMQPSPLLERFGLLQFSMDARVKPAHDE
jgi:hypothetical protein